jgi:hypothetical protein
MEMNKDGTMSIYNFFKPNSLNPFYSKNYKYYHTQGMLRMIENSIKSIFDYWLSEKKDNRNILLNILNTPLWKNAPEISALPRIIQRLLSDPRKLIPSLDKDISHQDIQELIHQMMQGYV